MRAFIDESGDPGFKLGRGSSPIFVTSMVVFRDDAAARHAGEIINALRKELSVKPEFKFSKLCDDYRDRFFEAIRECVFTCRFVVVDKSKIHSERLRNVKESFYNFFVKSMMKHDGGILDRAEVVIDGSGDRTFRRELGTYIKKQIGADRVSNVKLMDSTKDPLLQLADMVAGAIARAHQPGDKGNNRWMQQLRRNGQIQDV